MNTETLIDTYLAAPRLLRRAVSGMTDEELDAVPIPGQWSTRQVVCHIADFELVYADRMKRILAEDQPLLPGGDPGLFAAGLGYESRDVDEEIMFVEAVRLQIGRILRPLREEDFQRIGRHVSDGPLSLLTLLQRITDHLPHHVRFIAEKRAALNEQRASAGRV